MSDPSNLCNICKRPLALDTNDRLAYDCGGDCGACMYKLEGNLRDDVSDERLLEIMKADDEYIMNAEIAAREYLRTHRDPAEAAPWTPA